VPDQYLKTGGVATVQHCTAFGMQGYCLDDCIGPVQDAIAQGLLSQQDCTDSHNVCVPPVNPLNNQSTGAAAFEQFAKCADGSGGGTCDNPTRIDASAFPTCAQDGHCVPAAQVMAANPQGAALLATCPNSTDLCVPDQFLSMPLKLTACLSLEVTAGHRVPGSCVSLTVPRVAAQKDSLPQDICAATERCTPLLDPTSGQPTGISSPCDTRTPNPADVFLACNQGGARCVPKSAVPAVQQKDLAQVDCKDQNSFCVPNEVLNGGPFEKCTGGLAGQLGTCINDALAPPGKFLMASCTRAGSAASAKGICVACKILGNPTNAPGCSQLYNL
jgi:hypothetical protein